MELIGLGSIAMDIFLQVNELPREDDFAVIEGTSYQPGGSCANVVTQAARLGAKTGFSSCISDDSIGFDLMRAFEQEGVDCSILRIKPGGTTIHTDIVVDRLGRKFIMVDGGNRFYSMSEQDLPVTEIQRANVLYTDLFPTSPSIAALQIAKEAGVATVFNMQAGLPTYENMGADRTSILNALSYVNIFAPCRNELQDLAQTEDLNECIAYIRRYYNGLLILTRGKEGSLAVDSSGQIYHTDAVSIPVTDTTGAGDSFIGAFMVQYCLRGMDLTQSLQFASDCAGFTCMALGARTSPNWEQAVAFCRERGIPYEP